MENINEVPSCYYCGREIESPVPCGPTEESACPCCGLRIVVTQEFPFGVPQDEE